MRNSSAFNAKQVADLPNLLQLAPKRFFASWLQEAGVGNYSQGTYLEEAKAKHIWQDHSGFYYSQVSKDFRKICVQTPGNILPSHRIANSTNCALDEAGHLKMMVGTYFLRELFLQKLATCLGQERQLVLYFALICLA